MNRYVFILLFALVFICLNEAGERAVSLYFRQTLDMQSNLEGRHVPRVAGFLKWAMSDLVLCVVAGFWLPISSWKVIVLLALMLVLRVIFYHYLLTEKVVQRYICAAIMTPIAFFAIFLPWLLIAHEQDPTFKSKLKDEGARMRMESRAASQ